MLRDAQTSKTHNYFARTAVRYYRILHMRRLEHPTIYNLSFNNRSSPSDSYSDKCKPSTSRTLSRASIHERFGLRLYEQSRLFVQSAKHIRFLIEGERS